MSNPDTQLAVQSAPVPSLFANAELFELAQRQAKLIASSSLVPTQFQGNVANCAIALEMANRLEASPFAVMQNLDVIYGRPSWRAVFLMGLINSCGRFSPLQFDLKETGPERTVEIEIPVKGGKSIKQNWTYTPTRCVAWATNKQTGDRVEGPPVSYDMALQEGWVAKAGSKWLTEMRELMIRNRAASFFAKVHASDLMLGMQTSEEAYDSTPMRNITPNETDPADTLKQAAEKVFAQQSAEHQKRVEEAIAEEEAEDAAAEVIPPTAELKKTVREAIKANGLTLPEATEVCIGAGLIPKGKPLEKATDAEFFEITKNLDVLENAGKRKAAAKKDDKPAGVKAFVDYIKIEEGETPALGYKVGGKCFEAVTMAPDIIELLGTLTDDDEIHIVVQDQKSGPSIITKLELAEEGATA